MTDFFNPLTTSHFHWHTRFEVSHYWLEEVNSFFTFPCLSVRPFQSRCNCIELVIARIERLHKLYICFAVNCSHAINTWSFSVDKSTIDFCQPTFMVRSVCPWHTWTCSLYKERKYLVKKAHIPRLQSIARGLWHSPLHLPQSPVRHTFFTFSPSHIIHWWCHSILFFALSMCSGKRIFHWCLQHTHQANPVANIIRNTPYS